MINVTKPFLPPREEYDKYLNGIWQRTWLTNNGPLVSEFESELQRFIENPLVSFCTNGTIALQLAIKALQLEGEIITTPFSYVATCNSILWEKCTPVFVDIREDDFCINAALIEENITERTQAIMAVHVYGLPCDIPHIEQIAFKHRLKVIYDSAHAFGVRYDDKSILNYGDVSTCSFHSTKLFHTIEGGATICKDDLINNNINLLKQFGHVGDEYFSIGINGKTSEFHAAMGLCNLPYVPAIIKQRRYLSELYDEYLHFGLKLHKPFSMQRFEYNYAYYPVVFTSEQKLLEVKEHLYANGVNTRRYFYPSLNTLPFVPHSDCAVSERVAKCVLALPIYYDLDDTSVKRISHLINGML